MSSIGRGHLRCNTPGCNRVRPYWANHCKRHDPARTEGAPEPARPAVVSFKVAGEGYRNGTRVPGFGLAVLSTGGTLYVPEAEASRGLSAVLDYCERAGFDVTDARVRLETWVRTGT